MTHLSADDVEKKYLEACGTELGAVHNRLVSECAGLHLKWGEYVELFGTKPERIELLNRAAGQFFRVVQDSLWEGILLGLAQLVDSPKSSGKENLTLRRLPPMVAPELQVQLEELVNVCIGKCAFARDWRMRRIAHRDLGLALDRAEPLEPASRLTVREALVAVVAVLNAVEQHYLGSAVAYDVWNSDGSLQLLYVVRDGLEARDRRLARLRSGRSEPGDVGPGRAV